MSATNLKDKLDTMCPVAKLATIGTRLDGLITMSSDVTARTAEADALTDDLKSRVAQADALTDDLKLRVAEADSLTDDLKSRAAELKTLTDELRRVALNHVCNPAGLAIGSSSKAKILIANTVNYVLSGAFYTNTTEEVAFTATTHDIAADAVTVQEAVYLVSLNNSGTAKITMGAISAGAGTALVPACPANEVPIGYLRLAVAAGATPFDATTDELDGGHLTDTYVDLPYIFSSAATAVTAITASNMTAITASNMTAITASNMTAITSTAVEALP